ncbi:outer membrane protein OmpK [Acinetobacter junii]|uniref:outer membrane protein OmpK n=1 Tax=Acinetobacter junii TaxID=40215 RepID=UPI00124E4B14|nr:outer membrane protein OmpK [Acinetobacter junii]MDH0666857.1 ion channel protein Tsx [Acinetobacter junii]USR73296.1 ion channel protein Tsx [Acinetobacter junii]WRL35101.1 outer membrane protein OmpK [Acinetobacter junii]
MQLKQLAATSLLLSTAVFAQAKPIWQDFSLTGLYGENYEVVDEKQTTLTVEYAAKVKYADVFFFMDRMRGSDDHKSTYFELSPRLSLGEVSGQKLAFGPIKDVLISTTWESNNDDFSSFDNFLYGVGFDLAIPYFQYANVNFYRANNENTADDYQITIVYAVPFKVSSEDFLVDGFLDWSTAEKDHASELNWTTQYKWNVGKHISPETRLYLGVEHSVWNNKFGIKGSDENNVSALVKYHF